MIVNEFDFVGVVTDPSKADSPLIVDANAVLPTTISSELLEAICRGDEQILEGLGGIQQEQLSQRNPLKVLREPPYVFSSKDPTGVFVGKGFDHLLMITQRATSVKSLSMYRTAPFTGAAVR